MGSSQEIAKIKYVGCYDSFNNIGHGFGFPVRFKIEAANDEAFKTSVSVLQDQTKDDVPNPGTNPQVVEIKESISARYVRFTATKLANRSNDYIFALGELLVLTSDEKNAALGKRVTSLDSIQAPVRWQRKNLVDGYYFGVGAEPDIDKKLDVTKAAHQQLLQKLIPAELRLAQDQTKQQLESVAKQLLSLIHI